jgi:solute carrier family 25 oxoglutarate transporter 11
MYKSSFHAVINIAREEGIVRLYNGLSAGLLRQATYTTTRMGVYSELLDWLRVRNQGAAPSFLEKVLAGVMGGFAGALVGTPAELALIRMTSDGRYFIFFSFRFFIKVF